MDILTFFLATHNLPWIISATMLFALWFVEIVGFCLGHSIFLNDFGSFDADGNGIPDCLEITGLGWANPGKIPFMILTVIQLTVASILGFSFQYLALPYTGWINNWLLVPIVICLTIVISRFISYLISPFIPRDTTSAVTISSFVGQVGEVVYPPLDDELGYGKVKDSFSTTHYFSFKSKDTLDNHDRILLIALDDTTFDVVKINPYEEIK